VQTSTNDERIPGAGKIIYSLPGGGEGGRYLLITSKLISTYTQESDYIIICHRLW